MSGIAKRSQILHKIEYRTALKARTDDMFCAGFSFYEKLENINRSKFHIYSTFVSYNIC